MDDSESRVRPAFIIVLIVVSLVAAVGAAEIALRIINTPNAIGTQIKYRWHKGYYAYEPNIKFELKNERLENNPFEADERGLRNPAGAFSAADTIVLGDSFIDAVNTGEARTLPGQLRSKGIAAYNAGVAGMSTFDQYYLLRDHLPDSGKRNVVLSFYLGNDFHDNYLSNFFDQPIASSNDKASVASTPGKLQRALQRICYNLVVCQKLYERLWLGVVGGLAVDPMASYPISEMLMLRATDPRADIAIEKTRQVIGRLKEVVATRGGRLIVLGVPSKAQTLRSFKELSAFARDPRAEEYAEQTFRSEYSWDQPDRTLAKLCDGLAIEYVSLLSTFRTAQDQQPYYDLDPHWRDVGQRIAADAVAEKIRSRPVQ